MNFMNKFKDIKYLPANAQASISEGVAKTNLLKEELHQLIKTGLNNISDASNYMIKNGFRFGHPSFPDISTKHGPILGYEDNFFGSSIIYAYIYKDQRVHAIVEADDSLRNPPPKPSLALNTFLYKCTNYDLVMDGIQCVQSRVISLPNVIARNIASLEHAKAKATSDPLFLK